jgi:hypothetical protein
VLHYQNPDQARLDKTATQPIPGIPWAHSVTISVPALPGNDFFRVSWQVVSRVGSGKVI